MRQHDPDRGKENRVRIDHCHRHPQCLKASWAILLLALTHPPTWAQTQIAPNSCDADKISSTSLVAGGPTIKASCSAAGSFALQYCQLLCKAIIVTPSDPNAQKQSLSDLTALQRNPDFFVEASFGALTRAKLKQVFVDFETIASTGLQAAGQAVATKGTAVQTGATPESTGSTNLVSKPTTTSLVSVAAESGAFTDTSNGSTTTVSASAEGIRRFVAGDKLVIESTTDKLRHITVQATFNVSQPSSSQSTSATSANAGTPTSITSILVPVNNNLSFNSITAGYVIMRPVDPLSNTFQAKWNQAVAAAQKSLNPEITDVLNDYKTIFKDIDDAKVVAALGPVATAWETASVEDQKNGDLKKLARDFEVYAGSYEAEAEKENKALLNDKAKAVRDRTALNESIAQIFDQARGNLLTAQYTYSTQPNKPATHSITLAYAYAWNSGLQITANGLGSWYATVPSGALYGRLRAYQFSTELDKPLGPKANPGATLSLSAYGQNQSDKTVLNITAGNLAPGTNIPLPSNAQVLLGTTGWLGVGQAKLVINIPKPGGLSIPLAFKYSSKTDLRSSGDWRGQFGVSYDFSAISNLIMGK